MRQISKIPWVQQITVSMDLLCPANYCLHGFIVSSKLLSPWIYCVHQFTVSSKMLFSHLLLICTLVQHLLVNMPWMYHAALGVGLYYSRTDTVTKPCMTE